MPSDTSAADESGPLPITVGRRTALGLLMGLRAVLAGIVSYDIYADWMLEGKSLWSTLVENALPLTLAGLVKEKKSIRRVGTIQEDVQQHVRVKESRHGAGCPNVF